MEHLKIMVGCPAYEREWCLPTWFEHVERTFAKVGVEPLYVFVLAHGDEPTKEVVFKYSDSLRVTFTDQETVYSGRQWNEKRYHEMVRLRNVLLSMVREEAPDYFLSLDSDIFAHDDLLGNLLETAERFDAVGGKCFMTDTTAAGHGNTNCPSWANLGRDKTLRRQDADGMFPVDVIMAIKLMSPAAYAVDYSWNDQGEDLGWCANCREQGLKLGFDGRVTSKHVMSRNALTRIDSRVGW